MVRNVVSTKISDISEFLIHGFEWRAFRYHHQQLFQLSPSRHADICKIRNIGFHSLRDNLIEFDVEIHIFSKGVIASLQIVFEKGERVRHSWNCGFVGENVAQREYWHFNAMEKCEVFPERQSLHFIDGHTPAEVCHALVNVENR